MPVIDELACEFRPGLLIDPSPPVSLPAVGLKPAVTTPFAHSLTFEAASEWAGYEPSGEGGGGGEDRADAFVDRGRNIPKYFGTHG